LAGSPPTLSLNNIAHNLSPLFPYVFNYLHDVFAMVRARFISLRLG
jgi:hypothetical protein